MSFDIGGLIGLIIVVGVLIPTMVYTLGPILFRLITLPRMAREYGWLYKRRQAWELAWGPWVKTVGQGGPQDLPGSGTISWEYSLPESECEFLGTFNYQPVYGIEVAVRRRIFDAEHERWKTLIRRYSIVVVATSTQPFDGFHSRQESRTFTGDPLAFYPDFVDWVRNRKPQHREPLYEEGPGLRSISWQGRLTRKRILTSLDRLTADHGIHH